MKYMGSSITEYYTFLGEERGKKIGLKQGRELGEQIGEVKGALQNLHQLREEGVIDQSVYLQKAAPLQAKLETLQSKPAAPPKAKRKGQANPS
jgi:hypothetical protein